MTQDQYSEPPGPGHVARGAAPEGEADDYGTEQSKPKTRFQKVASALLGDKPDRDEADQEQAPQGIRGQAPQGQAPQGQAPQGQAPQGQAPQGQAPGTSTAASPHAVPRPDAAPGSGPVPAVPTWTPANSADEAAAASDPAGTAGDPAGTAGASTGTAAAGSPAGPVGDATAAGGTRPRDYWDEPQPAAGRGQAAAVANRDVPVTDAGPPARQAQPAGPAGTEVMDHQPTQPDLYGTAGAGRGAATIADVPMADTADTAGTAPGVPAGSTAGGTAAGTAAGTGAGETAGSMGAGAAGRPADGSANGESRPGALGDFSGLTYGNLIPDADQYSGQWQQIQFRFVDDPHGSVTEAADLVAQVTAKLEAAIAERQRAIEERQRAIAEQQRSLRGRWGEDTNADTEGLRETLRMYKTFLDQLLGPRTG